MRITFLGTGAFAVPSLLALLDAGHEIASVVCQPDRAKGRGLEVTPPPVKVAALERGLVVLQPAKIKAPESEALLRDLHPDLQVVVAYGQILPRRVIDLAPRGTVNVHGSVLPRWRGAAPIQWAIASGDERTGVSTMFIDEGLDTGPVLESLETAIGPEERARDLEVRLAILGAGLLRTTLAGIAEGTLVPRPQDPLLATHARPLEKRDGSIDWTLPARFVLCRMRGFDPWPGAFTRWNKSLVKILCAQEGGAAASLASGSVVSVGKQGITVACGEGTTLLVREVQPESRRPMPAHSFALGARMGEGASFTS